jgi:hypothetical protein
MLDYTEGMRGRLRRRLRATWSNLPTCWLSLCLIRSAQTPQRRGSPLQSSFRWRNRIPSRCGRARLHMFPLRQASRGRDLRLRSHGLTRHRPSCRMARSLSEHSPLLHIIFILTGTMSRWRLRGWKEFPAALAVRQTRKTQKQIPPRNSGHCKDAFHFSKAMMAATTSSGTGGGSGGSSRSYLRVGTKVQTKERGLVKIESARLASIFAARAILAKKLRRALCAWKFATPIHLFVCTFRE